MTTTPITLDQIETTTQQALTAHGATPEVATIMASAVRAAEANGNVICGLYYVESYCQQLITGRVDKAATPLITKPRPGIVAVDAANGFAQPAFMAARDEAIRTTRAQGTTSLVIHRAHTCTALGWFTASMAKAGLIAIGMTNASAIVAPPGGSKRTLGTNPIAMAVPDGKGGIAFQFDFATSATALGHVTQAAARGEQIPQGWAIDATGTPTTDPAEAVKGALLPAAGHRGFGIGLMVELLTGVLTGAALSTDTAALKAPEGSPHNLSQHMLLIDPEAVNGAHIWESLNRLATSIEEQEGARLPGTTGRHLNPVNVPTSLWQTIQTLATK